MSVDHSQMEEFQRRLAALRQDTPDIMEQLVVGEGVYAVKQARSICKEDGIVNNGTYRMNFHAGNRALMDPGPGEYDGSGVRRAGNSYKTDVYNNLDYAKHLEYGFRSHFVPGYWAGKTFVYQPGFPGGMWVGPRSVTHTVNRESKSMSAVQGGFVKGHFTLLRAVRRTKLTQDARLKRKINRIINQRLNEDGGEDGDAE